MAILHGLDSVPDVGDSIKNVTVRLYLHESKTISDYIEFQYEYKLEYESGKINILSGSYGDSNNINFHKYKKLFEKIGLDDYKTEDKDWYNIPFGVFKYKFET